ncbi:hypothetical protein GUITHDRAFT_122762 [Guillardia theta CCMP2712]|uniref:Uncharacterized protein n=1 Tax=Guillardia theta (strain CCMP2712) TaxID=905079 RepID=L1I5A4_GUITC|nr:hypothetical protein GUITHDRAFT_122762 [Guillardia theta CCMP2712]EKX31035.1 hypothetical protein GUITHDRAFT_122762 [Guillardia theta CCMP2712]|eukprot:XP_005818015.1 hypothetical protein GUITHDRAFT_122762 [Guillardia theta CCMP2712]
MASMREEGQYVTGGIDGSIVLWDVRSGRRLKQCNFHEGGVSALNTSGTQLFSGSWDRSLVSLDLSTGKKTRFLVDTGLVLVDERNLPSPWKPFSSAEYSSVARVGSQLLCARPKRDAPSNCPGLYAWNVGLEEDQTFVHDGHTSNCGAVRAVCSVGGSSSLQVYGGYADGFVRRWDMSSTRVDKTFISHSSSITAGSCSQLTTKERSK